MIDGRSYFGIKYLRGSWVFAKLDTLGIMTFKTYENAYTWMSKWNTLYRKNLMIIKVRPLSAGTIPERICSSVQPNVLSKFYNNNISKCYHDEPVAGTICYRGVEVLT
jgi:hypothetical protein